MLLSLVVLGQVFNQPSYLEDLTGLSKMHDEAVVATAHWDEDADDDF